MGGRQSWVPDWVIVLATVGVTGTIGLWLIAQTYPSVGWPLLVAFLGGVGGVAALFSRTEDRKKRKARTAAETAASSAFERSENNWKQFSWLMTAPPIVPPTPTLIDDERLTAHPAPADRDTPREPPPPPERSGWGPPAPPDHEQPSANEQRPAEDQPPEPEEEPRLWVVDRAGDLEATTTVASPGGDGTVPGMAPVDDQATDTAVPVPAVADRAGPADSDGVGRGASGPVWSGPAVLLLGPVVPVGWAQEPDRQVLVEVAAYLATHQERPVSSDELRAAVWNEARVGEREVARGTVNQSVSRLRRCVGSEHLPEATAGSGYRLASTFSSDWFRFQALVEAAGNAEGERVGALYREALGLVRGRPFAGVSPRTYGWVWEELLVAQMEAAISAAAHRAYLWLRDRFEGAQGEWVARQGLLAVPYDETLHEHRLEAAACMPDWSLFKRVWRDASEALGDQAEHGPVGATYRDLRDHWI